MNIDESTARAIIASTNQEKPDGVWLVGLDSELANVRSYSGVCKLVVVEGERYAELSPALPWSTHPGQIRTTASGTPDVDGDGLRDVAWALPRTVYPMRGKRNSGGRFNPATTVQPVLRNHTGAACYRDVRLASAKVWSATAIQLHAGASHKPVAIGCFTLAPKHFDVLAPLIEKHASRGFRIAFAHVETSCNG